VVNGSRYFEGRSASVFWDQQSKKTGRYAVWFVIVSEVLSVRAANLRIVDMSVPGVTSQKS